MAVVALAAAAAGTAPQAAAFVTPSPLRTPSAAAARASSFLVRPPQQQTVAPVPVRPLMAASKEQGACVGFWGGGDVYVYTNKYTITR